MFSGPRVASIGWVQGKAYVGVMRRTARSSGERGYYLADILIERGRRVATDQASLKRFLPLLVIHLKLNNLHYFSVWFVMIFIVCVPFRTLSQQKPLARR